MKKQYVVSFERNGVNQVNAYIADSAEQAAAYCQERKPDATIYGAREDSTNYARRGMPVVTVPDGWTPAAAEPSAEPAEPTENSAAADETTSSAADVEKLEPLPYEPEPTREEISKADFIRALVFNRSRFLAVINEPVMNAGTLQASIIPENVKRLKIRDAKNSGYTLRFSDGSSLDTAGTGRTAYKYNLDGFTVYALQIASECYLGEETFFKTLYYSIV